MHQVGSQINNRKSKATGSMNPWYPYCIDFVSHGPVWLISDTLLEAQQKLQQMWPPKNFVEENAKPKWLVNDVNEFESGLNLQIESF